MGCHFLHNMRMMRIDAHPMRIGRCIRMANPSACSFQAASERRDWKQPRSPCVLPPADHPHRPESHQWSHCPLSNFQKHFWHFPGSHSTEDTAFLTFWCWFRFDWYCECVDIGTISYSCKQFTITFILKILSIAINFQKYEVERVPAGRQVGGGEKGPKVGSQRAPTWLKLTSAASFGPKRSLWSALCCGCWRAWEQCIFNCSCPGAFLWWTSAPTFDEHQHQH